MAVRKVTQKKDTPEKNKVNKQDIIVGVIGLTISIAISLYLNLL